MSNSGKWWIGAIILLILSAIFSFFGPYSALKNSKEMGSSIQTSLNAAKLGDIKVDMAGNVAKLSGVANSDADRVNALRLAENATCKTCKGNKEKSWHEAKDDGISVKKPDVAIVSPYTFVATKRDDGRVVLNGYLPSQAAINSVVTQAKTLYPAGVVNKTLKVASGQPNAKWRDTVGAQLASLADLSTGKAAIRDLNTSLTGAVGNIVGKSNVESAYAAAIAAPYKSKANITAPDAAPEPAPMPAPAPEVTSQDSCQSMFDGLKADGKINFTSARAEIRPGASMKLLDKVVGVAKQCARFNITVEGHTDWEGANEYNQWLSEGRAKTVVAYLADHGVNVSRLNAVGYGETQPIASNETREGMAKNRRIEFKVTRSE